MNWLLLQTYIVVPCNTCVTLIMEARTDRICFSAKVAKTELFSLFKLI
jgi:hypothetical protein